jgi:hypothetical protein
MEIGIVKRCNVFRKRENFVAHNIHRGALKTSV